MNKQIIQVVTTGEKEMEEEETERFIGIYVFQSTQSGIVVMDKNQEEPQENHSKEYCVEIRPNDLHIQETPGMARTNTSSKEMSGVKEHTLFSDT